MKEYLEETLRQKITIEEYTTLYKKLPLIYRGNYFVYEITMSGVMWVAMKPKKDIGLVELRKNRAMVAKVSGQNCALILEKTNYYTKEKMIEEGIPFIIPNKQIYLPFVGILLTESEGRKLQPVHMISYLTQKLLLCALYEKWKDMTVTKVAEKLQVTKMSVSRCFDEIEYLDIPVIGMKGKSRTINIMSDPKEMWEEIKSVMRDPVIMKYELVDDIQLKIKAGMSALCEYSLLSDNEYPTYAITKKELNNIDLKKVRKVLRGESIGCVVLELGYLVEFPGKGVQDPLSTMLSITEQEKEDERVISSINEMLKENAWLKD